MQTNILNKLKEIELEKGVEILYAVESGSRAWGFASPDSDYDIRFIYKHDLDYYLSLWEQPDTIEFMTTDNLDGSGWDLRKTVRLLAKSNAPLLEWLSSPVVYYENETFINQMRALAKDCFSPVACLHHYLGTTKNFMEVCQAEEVKLKSYFYALRTALAGKWIIEKNRFPPVDFMELLPIAPHNLQEKIKELMQIKANQDEKYLHPKEVLITDFLQETVVFNQEHANSLGSGEKMAEELDGVFRGMITYK
ncbi:nucleotidyltransferase domain-containing protein [Flavobacterium columnare]|uniref:Nucleotidyltransferase n=2 Tax=Flavobacterium columnare TaxID=996 RepID=G8X547_FLACA|nr:nucleotidyltransferase domain-containing protein [Flavobacterium columnare]AEW85458.2 putative nucleotidyltransferase [Flavobacterium columnare ATCC 49512]AMO20139.1 nucleotidyltransferase domain-containing protein [Flavobacterium columnare]AUX18089.1 nucleotidyltransferase [Flavobacterium columnare]QOG57158.1 nucleotidyltransferase domain-containing protein [Flavobacterium columnare]QOG59882.1 nucleotidyltransferase domain-containing protein [Flavobacterium columnare]